MFHGFTYIIYHFDIKASAHSLDIRTAHNVSAAPNLIKVERRKEMALDNGNTSMYMPVAPAYNGGGFGGMGTDGW